MSFDIVSGSVGFLGGLVILCAISMGLIAVFVFVTLAKRAHDTVIEDEQDRRPGE